MLLILPCRSGRAWSTQQHRHHLVEGCKSRGSSTSTSTHPALATPLMVGSALHHWELPEPMGATGQGGSGGSRVCHTALVAAANSYGLCRGKRERLQCKLCLALQSRMFPKTALQGKKKVLIQQSI